MNCIHVPQILMPNTDTDLYKWSVVACDQYTSEPKYWEEVCNTVGDAPSTLKITFPEIYLEDGDGDKRIADIKNYCLKSNFRKRKNRPGDT